MPQEKSHRIERINSLIQQVVGKAILELVELKSIVTVSKVETSRDMKWAKVWVSIIGEDDDATLKILKANIYDIQGELNRTLKTKVLPRISFMLDTSPRYAEHISELINKIHEEE